MGNKLESSCWQERCMNVYVSVLGFQEIWLIAKQTGTRIITNALIYIVMSSWSHTECMPCRHASWDIFAECWFFKSLNIIWNWFDFNLLGILNVIYLCHNAKSLSEVQQFSFACCCYFLWRLTVLNDYRFNVHDHQLSAKLAHRIY